MSNDEIEERINLLKDMAALEEGAGKGMSNDDIEDRITLLRQLIALQIEAAEKAA